MLVLAAQNQDYLESTGWIFMENSFNKYTDVNKEAPSANSTCIP
jgi:hypothetical protein